MGVNSCSPTRSRSAQPVMPPPPVSWSQLQSRMDEGAGMIAPSIALRAEASDGSGAIRFWVGVIDLVARCFVCLRSVTLSAISEADCAAASYRLADGPTLCVIAAEKAPQAASSHVMLAIGCTSDDGETEDDDEHGDAMDADDGAAESGKRRLRGGGAASSDAVALRLAGRPKLLCPLTWPRDAGGDAGGDVLSAMLLLPTEADDHAADGLLGAVVCPIDTRPSAAPASASSLSRAQFRAPALATLSGGSITCVTPQRVLGTSGAVHRSPRMLTRIWVGMSDCSVHCCGCDGEVSPLVSLSTPRMPQRVEPLPMQHGSDAAVLAVLCDAPTQLLLISTLGEILRTFDAASTWLCDDFLGVGFPQLLVGSPSFEVGGSQPPMGRGGEGVSATTTTTTTTSAAIGTSTLRGYTLAGLSSTFAQVPLSARSRSSSSSSSSSSSRRQEEEEQMQRPLPLMAARGFPGTPSGGVAAPTAAERRCRPLGPPQPRIRSDQPGSRADCRARAADSSRPATASCARGAHEPDGQRAGQGGSRRSPKLREAEGTGGGGGGGSGHGGDGR